MIYHYKNTNQLTDGMLISPLEFNAIFHEGINLRHELTEWSKIRDPVPAKFKHVTNIVTCTLLWCNVNT